MNRLKLIRDKFLIASPQLADDNFSRTVVYLLQHDENGSFGVVLNRPVTQDVRNAWLQFAGELGPLASRVRDGGPLFGPVFALHDTESLGGIALPSGVFLSVDSEQIKTLSASESIPYRIYLGLAGWELGQLEKEIKQGLWLMADATKDDIFSDSDTLWENTLRRRGRELLGEMLGVDRFPPDPHQN